MGGGGHRDRLEGTDSLVTAEATWTGEGWIYQAGLLTEGCRGPLEGVGCRDPEWQASLSCCWTPWCCWETGLWSGSGCSVKRNVNNQQTAILYLTPKHDSVRDVHDPKVDGNIQTPMAMIVLISSSTEGISIL